MTRRMRLAIFITVLWVFSSGALFLAASGPLAALVVSLLPTILCWGIWWVISGAPSRRNPELGFGTSLPQPSPVAMPPDNAASMSTSRRDVWAAATWGAIIIAFAIPIAVGVATGQSTPTGEAVGRMLFYLLLVGFAAMMIGKSGNQTTARAILVVVMVSIGIWQGARLIVINAETQRDQASLRKSIDSIAASLDKNAAAAERVIARDNQPSSVVPITHAAAPDQSTANLSAVLEDLASFIAVKTDESNKYQDQYSRRVAALPLSEVLIPTNLATPSGRAKSRETIAAYEALLNDGIGFQERQSATLRQWVGQRVSRLPPTEARSFQAGFEESYSKNTALNSSYYQTERKLVRMIRQIIDTVESAPGGVSLSAQGQLLFADQTALGVYNGLIKNMASVTKEESDIAARMVALRREQAEKAHQLATSLSNK